jgi:hypothetical protein
VLEPPEKNEQQMLKNYFSYPWQSKAIQQNGMNTIVCLLKKKEISLWLISCQHVRSFFKLCYQYFAISINAISIYFLQLLVLSLFKNVFKVICDLQIRGIDCL